MTEEEKAHKEEQQWLKRVQKKFIKYVTNWKWDCITLTTTQYEIISTINSVTNVDDLPLLINERVVDHIFQQIETKFKLVKQSSTNKEL